MDEVTVIERLKKSWGETSQGVPAILSDGPIVVARVVFRFEELQITVFLEVGKRGRITETIYAVDPTRTVILDQLVVAVTDSSGEGHLINRSEMKRLLADYGKRGAAIRVLNQAVDKARSEVALTRMTLSMLRDSPATSIGTVSGGLPSLGKRHS